MSTNQVFVDTSGFIALQDQDDQFHAQARLFQRAVLQNGWQLVTTSYVLAEAYTWIRLHLGHRQAVSFGQAVQNSRIMTIVYVNMPRERVAWGIFAGHNDKTYSFTDCVSFAVMQQMDIHRAFAFDHHFAQFALLPGRD